MHIAVEGCAHGELDKIYETIQEIEEEENFKVDLLICCGDFQSTRNVEDLQCMAVPRKYLDICTFYKYYSGEKKAPMLTIFIGGNHEASNYLQELAYGGWVAPNIYYLGYAGVVRVNGVRIGGISGIFKGYNYNKGHFEFPPYDENNKKSVYHIRSSEIFRLKQLTPKMDIMLSHDWPGNITRYGNVHNLLRFKPFFRDDIESGRLGSPPCEELIYVLKPRYWFSAHLHCRFVAKVIHSDKEQTDFLALDKCLPRRSFLEIITWDDEPEPDQVEPKLEYDLEWLTVLFLTNNLLNVRSSYTKLPRECVNSESDATRKDFRPTEEELESVKKKFGDDLKIPMNFVKTAPAFNPDVDSSDFHLINVDVKPELNPQTTAFCEKLGIDDPLFLALSYAGMDMGSLNLNSSIAQTSVNTNETLDLTSTADRELSKRAPLSSFLPKPKWSNDEEIDLGDSDDEANVLAPDDSKVAVDLSNPTKILESLEEAKKSDCPVAWDLSVKDESASGASSSAIETSPEVISPPLKKFKRRNENMYAPEED